MSEIEKRARELLAAEYERRGSRTYAESLIVTPLWAFGDDESAMGIRAIIAALTPPEGYVLVPVEPTPEMLQAAAFGVAGKSGQKFKPMMSAGYSAMLAARPEVSGG